MLGIDLGMTYSKFGGVAQLGKAGHEGQAYVAVYRSSFTTPSSVCWMLGQSKQSLDVSNSAACKRKNRGVLRCRAQLCATQRGAYAVRPYAWGHPQSQIANPKSRASR